jgi:hypothetical protein
MSEEQFGPAAESLRMKSFNAAIDVKMTVFEGHKPTLLSIIREAHNCGPKAEPFDDAKSWYRLEIAAHQYFMQERTKQEAMSSADREARLRKIGNALNRAHSLIEEVLSNEVGDDLFSMWSEKIDLPAASIARNQDGSLIMAHPAEEMFKKTVACLTDLKTAADRAADEVHRGRGRPAGARVLPLGYLEALAEQYTTAAGTRPGPGGGSFVQFVCAFLAALGRASISQDYVIELIRDAISPATVHPGDWAPSPFSDKPSGI